MYVGHINPHFSPTPSRSTLVPTHSLSQFVLPIYTWRWGHPWSMVGLSYQGPTTLVTKSPLSLVVIS